MELDETDPAVWLKLEAAVEKYIRNNFQTFKNVCERLLLPYQNDEKWSENMRTQHYPKAKGSSVDVSGTSLGWRHNVLLVEASHNPDSGRTVCHARALESFCSCTGIWLSLIQGISGIVKTAPAATFPTPFASPLSTGSFPSSPFLYSPDFGPQRLGRIDAVPHLSLDGESGKAAASPPISPPGPRKLSLPVRSLHEKLQNSPQVGIIHLSLQNDSFGSILSWQNDVFVVAEPGELADKFVQCVKFNLFSVMWRRRKKEASLLSNISTVADLVALRPQFQIGSIVHRYIGRQTQVMEDDQEIGAYMFRRTVPSMHLTPGDIRWMVGAWKDRIIICTGTYGLNPTLIKAFLDSGAKAVVCSSTEPPETQLTNFHGSGEFNIVENVKFEIGEDEVEDEEAEPASSMSDPEKIGDRSTCWDEDEEELSKFACELYDSLFRDGASVDVALKHALASHRRLRYSCHLPSRQ